MTTEVAVAERHDLDDQTLFALVSDGDCKKLSPEQRLAYYRARCDAAGLDPRAQPFQFITLNNKLVLYALKAATDQLTAKHGIQVEILSQATEAGIRIVTVRATTRDGRSTDEIGAVAVDGLRGDNLCNALMKATTKAKRRAVLGVCGLGLLDETELETCGASNPAPTREPARAPVRHLTDLTSSSPASAPAPSAPPAKPQATTEPWPEPASEAEYRTFTIRRVFADKKEGTSKAGKPYSFVSYKAMTEEGIKLSTLSDSFGAMLREGAMVSAVIAPEAKYGAHEIIDLREVVDGDLSDVWPDAADLEI